MKRIFPVVVLLVMFTATFASADQAGKKQAALTLLEVTNARNMTDQIMKSMEEMMDRQFQEASEQLSPEGLEMMESARQETVTWLRENLSWDQMKEMYVDIYTQVFTEDEIAQLVQFYQSPLGRKMLEKMPELVRLSLEKSQALVQQKMPLFQKKLQKTLAELETKYASESSKR